MAALAAVFWGLLWYGLIDLLVVVEQDEQFRQHYLFESGWGLLYLIVVAAPLIVLAIRPGDPIAVAQLAVATLGASGGGITAAWGVLAIVSERATPIKLVGSRKESDPAKHLDRVWPDVGPEGIV